MSVFVSGSRYEYPPKNNCGFSQFKMGSHLLPWPTGREEKRQPVWSATRPEHRPDRPFRLSATAATLSARGHAALAYPARSLRLALQLSETLCAIQTQKRSACGNQLRPHDSRFRCLGAHGLTQPCPSGRGIPSRPPDGLPIPLLCRRPNPASAAPQRPPHRVSGTAHRRRPLQLRRSRHR